MSGMKISCLLAACLMLSACSPVKLPVKNQYQLTNFSTKSYSRPAGKLSILVSRPEAAAGYQTNQMLYMDKPYQLMPFVHNSWTDAPAGMLFPLVVQSLQRSGYFYAVASSPYAEHADYRLDMQLLKLQQNFLVKPSRIELSVKVTLTNTNNSQVIGSRIFDETVSCPTPTPYGGVVAANQAVKNLTANITAFAINIMKHR